MANIEGMKDKFIVIKKEDAVNYLSPRGILDLTAVLCTINSVRQSEGKKQNTYLVINTDEEYADDIIDILKAHGHWG